MRDCNLDNNAKLLQYIIENHVAYKYIKENDESKSLLAFYREGISWLTNTGIIKFKMNGFHAF